jgi:hypothetical protein
MVTSSVMNTNDLKKSTARYNSNNTGYLCNVSPLL